MTFGSHASAVKCFISHEYRIFICRSVTGNRNCFDAKIVQLNTYSWCLNPNSSKETMPVGPYLQSG